MGARAAGERSAPSYAVYVLSKCSLIRGRHPLATNASRPETGEGSRLDEDDDRSVDEHVLGTAGGTDERCVEGMTATTGPPYASSRVARHDCVSRHVARRHRTGTNH